MRIISGTAKGRRLTALPGLNTRPTSDRIKESLFNVIAPDLSGARFLDLFAGSGAIGLEALSRGASGCAFIESNSAAMKVLRKNIETTGFSDIAETYLAGAEDGLRILANKNKYYDIIFMDPPYAQAAELIKRISCVIGELKLLSNDGYVISEHGSDIDISTFENIIPIKKKSYGKTTVISFWQPMTCQGGNERVSSDLNGG